MEEATSLRQAAEWGMRAIQGAFPRLKDDILYESCSDGADEFPSAGRERRIILKLMPMIYNYRLEKVGLNQLRNTYVPEWSKDSDYIVGGDFMEGAN